MNLSITNKLLTIDNLGLKIPYLEKRTIFDPAIKVFPKLNPALAKGGVNQYAYWGAGAWNDYNLLVEDSNFINITNVARSGEINSETLFTIIKLSNDDQYHRIQHDIIINNSIIKLVFATPHGYVYYNNTVDRSYEQYSFVESFNVFYKKSDNKWYYIKDDE